MLFLKSCVLYLAIVEFYVVDSKTIGERILRDYIRDPAYLQSHNLSAFAQQLQPAVISPQIENSYATAEPSNGISTHRSAPVNTGGCKSNINEQSSDFIAYNVLRLAHDIGQQFTKDQYSSTSKVFSPLSVMSALALLLLGAKYNTYEELKYIFGLDSYSEFLKNPNEFHEQFSYMLEDLQSGDINVLSNRKNVPWRDTVTNYDIRPPSKADEPSEHIIKVANGLFAQYGKSLNPDYLNVIGNAYKTQLVQLDFQQRQEEARSYINSWVASNTFGKIPSIISELIPRDTNIILASALYFKAFWQTPFLKAVTIMDDFYPDGVKMPPIKVEMMATGGVFPFYNSIEYDCRIIGLPYKGNTTTMYIIQPNSSSRSKLQELQQYLDPQKIEEIISKMVQKTAVIAFPKMHLVRETNIRDILNNLGVRSVFSRGSSDLSLIENNLSRSFTPTSTSRSNSDQTACKSEQDCRRIPLRPTQFVQRLKNSPSSVYQNSLNNLEAQRNILSTTKSDLFVENILHKVVFDVNEQGTEAAAATLTYLRRSGTEVLFRADTPFLVLIRHDPTKLVLFYGIIYQPEL